MRRNNITVLVILFYSNFILHNFLVVQNIIKHFD